MSYSLLMDTTQARLMLALSHAEKLIARFEDSHTSHQYHSSTLHPHLMALLVEGGLHVRDLKAVVVNLGPGSFTGIRTGIVVARTLGQFLPVSLYGFSTFELIAAQETLREKPITVLLNAFRQRYHKASLVITANGSVEWLEEAAIFPNTQPPKLQTDCVVIEPSLTPLVTLENKQVERLDTSTFFSPLAMLFLMRHRAENAVIPWQKLSPLYLQEPHVTLSTK